MKNLKQFTPLENVTRFVAECISLIRTRSRMLRASSLTGLAFIALAFLVWGTPVQAVDPDLIDVVEIIGTNPFIVHTNILPGDSFTDIMTVNNLTGTAQDIVMGLDIDLSEGIVPWPPFELEERITIKIEKVGIGYIILPGPGGDTEATLQELDDTVIGLGNIAGSSSQVYKIYALFDENAGNEYQNTKVYFNITMSVDVPDAQGFLQIVKTNDSVAPETPGNEVEYTLRVTALHGGVNDVVLTDLPPEGFVYVSGSATGAPFIHEYASPGVWDLGDLAEDETVTVTYKTKISGSQDDGLYKDLAFATGTNGSGPVIAVDPSDPEDLDNFVGTEVAVVTPTSESVQLKEKDKTDTTTKRIIKRVLGASILPATGANISWVIFALILFVSGLGMMMYSKRKKALAMNNSNKIITKILLLFILGASVFALPSIASAANISVRIETPKALVNSPDFKIGFVVLDISNGTPDVVCEVNNGGGFTSFPAAHIEYVAQSGGNSGNCVVDATVMPADGDYTFRVTANDSVLSGEVPVELISATPGTPINYNREKNSCGVSFTTANDGLTTGVELYRSTETSFVADASTFIATLSIAPNTNGAMIDTTADCGGGDNFYAIRAVSITGAGSGFVGDDNVNVKHKTNTKTVTETIAGPAVGGAIPVTGGGAVAGGETIAPTPGSVEGAETENASGENGSVLGEGTIAGDAISWISGHPWWSALIALVLLVLGYRGYQAYQKKRNEQPLQ